MGLHEVPQFFEILGTQNNDVRIEYQDILALRPSDSQIITGGIAGVAGILDEDCLREFCSDHFPYAVVRRIINHDNLIAKIPAQTVQALKLMFDEVFGFVV
jgi:hypothetical protein